MCGIAGWLDYSKNLTQQAQNVTKISQALRLRGSDGEQIIEEEVALIERRSGLSPLIFSTKLGDNKFSILFDGKLFNGREVKQALITLGWGFETDFDNEITLKAYLEWGAESLERLNGVFAFSVFDHYEKRLFSARDRIGVKPFFYYANNQMLIFGSEIKALMASSQVPPILDKESLGQIMLLGPGRSPGSGVIKGVKELKPGEYLTFTKKGLSVKCYWKPKAKQHKDDLAKTLTNTRELIIDSIEKQLEGDKPAVSFLSGGLDSSIIAMVASQKAKNNGQEFITYSVDYEDNDKYFVKNQFQPDSDGKYIKIMTEFINSQQKNIVLNNLEVAKAIKDATRARDLPGMADIDSSLLLFCKKVRESHDLGLSGECADEIFGGYPWYHNPSILFNEAFPWSASTELRKLLFKTQLVGGDIDEFVHSEYRSTVEATDSLDDDSPLERRMRQMFMLNFYWFMQTLVDRNDRMSSSANIEVRVPLCDYRIVEYAYNMPWHMKALNGREKGIVREAFKDLLPQAVVTRKKSPFPKTYSPVLFDYVSQKAIELVNEKDSLAGYLINKSFLEELQNKSFELKSPWYGQLMRVPQIFGYIIQLDTFIKEFNLKLE